MREGKYPVIIPGAGHGERVRPHRLRDEVVGAEAARVRGLQRLAVVSRGETVDRIRAPPLIERVEQFRSQAVAGMPHCRDV